MTADLVAFMNAQLDEEEAAARAAIKPSEMHPYGDEKIPPITPEQVPDQVRGYLGGTWGEHFARHDPARVLADVQAKRALLTAYTEAEAAYQAEGGWEPILTAIVSAFHTTVRVLASVYADHPDFDPAWRVSPSGGEVHPTNPPSC